MSVSMQNPEYFKPNSNFTKFQKCGEITTSADGKDFGLNCLFCQSIFLYLDVFIEHIQANHLNEVALFAEKLLTETVLPIEPKSEEFDEITVASDLVSSVIETRTAEDPLAECLENEIIKNIKEEVDSTVCDASEIALKKENPSDTERKSDCEYNTDTDSMDTDTILNSNTDLLNLKNREILNYVIETYRNQPILWNPEDLEFMYIKKKRRILVDLSNKLKQIFNVTIDQSNIRKQFLKLRRLHQEEMRKFRQCNNQHDYVAELWCFEKLSFLNDRPTTTKERSSITAVNDEQLREIAETYKQHPCLWDFDHEDNGDKSRKIEAKGQMLQQVSEKLNIKLTLTDLQVYISRLRKMYASEKRFRLQAEKMKTSFKPSSEFYNLMQFLEHSIGPYKCEKCGQSFPSHDKFRVHLAEHDGEMPFKCKICNKGIRKLGNLRVHLRRHYRKAEFLCTECGKGFPTSSDLNKHLNTHSEACEFSCDQCGKAFSRLSFLNRHKANHDSSKAHKCTICSKAFYKMYKYKEHMNSHLNQRSCICEVCDKGFFSRKTLAQHRKTHAQKKEYTCPICRKDYARPASFYSHMKVQHSIEKKEYKINNFVCQ